MNPVTKLVIFVVVCGLLLLVILLPLSLQRVSYNEVAIRYDKVSRDLGTKLLREGLQDVGPSGTLLTFETSQRDASFIGFSALTSDGLQISLSIVVTYSINVSFVFNILNDFGNQQAHDVYIYSVCADAIYTTTSMTSTNDFYLKRQTFQQNLQNAISTIFATYSVYADLYFVQVININLPPGIQDSLTNTTIAQQDVVNAASERGAAIQQAQINFDLATSQANITILQAELNSAVVDQQAAQSVLAIQSRLELRSQSFVNVSQTLGNGGDFFVLSYLKPLVLAKGLSRTVINV